MSDDALTWEKMCAAFEELVKIPLRASDVTWEFRVSHYVPSDTFAVVIDTHEAWLSMSRLWEQGPPPRIGPQYLVIAPKQLDEGDQLAAIELFLAKKDQPASSPQSAVEES